MCKMEEMAKNGDAQREGDNKELEMSRGRGGQGKGMARRRE